MQWLTWDKSQCLVDNDPKLAVQEKINIDIFVGNRLDRNKILQLSMKKVSNR